MTFTQAQAICLFAENNLSIRDTARDMYRSESGLQYILDGIERKTGLNPRCFHHLVELLPMARAVLEENGDGDT